MTSPDPSAGCPVAHGTLAAEHPPEREIRAAIEAMVADPEYPCVGAKSVFNRKDARVVVLDRLADPGGTVTLLQELSRFSADHPCGQSANPRLASFVAAFRGPRPSTEEEFEDLLWRQLSLLHGADEADWDPRVSSDPADPHFGFSVAGRAFFVIGMHPAASRIARRTPVPVLVFNLHDQFDQLRASGRYARVRDTVRRRDARLQGEVNPMVADHGIRSEAPQYSGRLVSEGWRPPYDLATNSREGDQ